MGLSQTVSDALQATREGGVHEYSELVSAVEQEVSGNELEELLESEEPLLVRVAIELLFKSNPDKKLVKRLFRFREHDNSQIRHQLAMGLMIYEDLKSYPEMLLDLLQDSNNQIRKTTLELLVKCDPSHPELSRVLLGDSSWEVRFDAAKILSKSANDKLLSLFLEVLGKDEDSDVRFEVIKPLNKYFENNARFPDEVEVPKIAVLNNALEKLPDSPACKHVKSWLNMVTKSEFDEAILKGFGSIVTSEESLKNLPRAWNSDKSVTTLKKMLTGDPPQSVVLLGESGAGKTALVNELAHELSQADPPWCLLQISSSDFLKGTKFLGEWETLLTKIVDAVSHPKRVILYVPSIHELNTVGKSSTTENNIASALTPFMDHGDIRILGETTERQLQEDFITNPTFKRLLTPMTLQEADEKETQEIVKQVLVEEGLEPNEDFIDRISELSEFSQAGTVNPGRTVGLLRQVLQQHTDKSVLPADREILKAIGNATGVSTDLLDDAITLNTKEVRDFFESKVIGQPEAVNAAVDLVTLIKARLTDPDKPFGVNLFVGPTGVGKTELAKALAEYCFGDVNRLSRLDMSEFASYDSFERLNGSTGRPGMLTSIVRKQPFSIILLDEIEKAHITVFDLCLQIFDAGRLTDGQGKTADFCRSIIIMTSNVGANISDTKSLGFSQPGEEQAEVCDGLETQIHRELGHTFRPEFLNRLDRVVLFRPLSEETAEKIARVEVDRVLKRNGITGRKLTVSVAAAVYPLIAREGYSRAFGARPLKRVIERLLLLPVARKLAAGKIPPESVINISARLKQLTIDITKPVDSIPQSDVPQSEESIELKEIESRIETMLDDNIHLSGRKSMLLRRTSNPGFWDNREYAKQISNEIYQIESALKQMEWIHNKVKELSGKKIKKEELIHLNLRTKILESIATSGGVMDWNDVYLTIKVLSQRGEATNGLTSLAQMYRNLAGKFQFSCEAIADQKIERPDEDSLILKISGIGAAMLLKQETGMHEIIRKYPAEESRGKDREMLEVNVLADLSGLHQLNPDDFQFDIQPLKSTHGRLIQDLHWDVRIMHTETYYSMHVHTDGNRSTITERLLPFIFTQVTSSQNQQENEKMEMIRTYELGQSGVIKDHRLRQRSGRVEEVFQGNLDKFLILAGEQAGEKTAESV